MYSGLSDGLIFFCSMGNTVDNVFMTVFAIYTYPIEKVLSRLLFKNVYYLFVLNYMNCL